MWACGEGGGWGGGKCNEFQQRYQGQQFLWDRCCWCKGRFVWPAMALALPPFLEPCTTSCAASVLVCSTSTPAPSPCVAPGLAR